MAHGTRLAERKRRTRTGCLNCSRRRRKCDEAKPTCTGCKRRGEDCQWRMLGSFRDANIKVLESDHPSMSQGGAVSNNKRQSKFKILNNLSNLPRSRGIKRQIETETVLDLSLNPDRSEERGLSPPSTKSNDTAPTFNVTPEDHQTYVAVDTTHTPDTSPDQIQGLSPPLSGRSQIPQDPSHECVRNGDNQEHVSRTVPLEATSQGHYANDLHCDFEPPSLHDDASSNAYLNSSPEFVIDDLTTLRNLTQSSQFQPSVPGSYESHSPLFNHSIFSDPADFTNDVFLPGSTYEALHTTLRNRQLWTARPDVTSLCSPRGSISHIHTPTPFSDSDTFSRSGREPRRSRPGRFIDLSPEREHMLWQNYLNEICSWLDMFDNNHHFASTFPQMAKTAPHLRYSMLALSARQLERLQNKKSQSESLSLYQEAIHLLLPELENKTTPVIASCVILCVLEMLSCNPKEWRRHLDGCAYLIQAAGINGFSGKEEQALFWCFARMDLCGGLISEEETIIPIHNWRPRDMSCVEASLLFLSSAKNNFDTYANYTVYLCAETLGVLFGNGSKAPHPCTSCQSVTGEEGYSYVHRWQEVFSHAELWYENRPNQMKPVFTAPVATPDHTGRNRPFPTVLYGNGDAISGNQLYHVCALLLLQRKPKTLNLPKKPKSVLWHARQICAISVSNAHHGCWTNALQPLWIAGKVMSHYSEHAAIVETLIQIEHETGWATAWRVEDLKEFWGDYDNDDECDVDMD
ncbi:uncharacterized protein N7484_004595 [Penicillium longicatenatum]|uniref:uncharacterized protein n=1 Tax=Penicillium longicatenatum TaxID=1561947 RepID=UPI0025497413|nr:uncharacterized protein N7484_004595 [Penicillium longicatenatum]KAJ5650872.1 hypothetical protein N7484_004595 [Penicillium longicatenatum]